MKQKIRDALGDWKNLAKEELKTYAEIAKFTKKNIKTNSIFLRKNRMMGPPIVRLAKKLLNYYKK